MVAGGCEELRKPYFGLGNLRPNRKQVVPIGCGWFRAVADGFGWLRVVSDGCGWIRMVADGRGGLREVAEVKFPD